MKRLINQMIEYTSEVVTKQKSECRESTVVTTPVAYHGVTDIHFCRAGVKANFSVFQTMLKEVAEPLNDTLFVG